MVKLLKFLSTLDQVLFGTEISVWMVRNLGRGLFMLDSLVLSRDKELQKWPLYILPYSDEREQHF